MGLDPFAHALTLVPRRIVPDHEQGALALSCKISQEPRQERTGDLTDRAIRDKAHEHLRQRRNVKTITGNRFGFVIRLGNFLFDQAERLVFRPGMEGGLFLTTPPGFVRKAQGNVRI